MIKLHALIMEIQFDHGDPISHVVLQQSPSIEGASPTTNEHSWQKVELWIDQNLINHIKIFNIKFQVKGIRNS